MSRHGGALTDDEALVQGRSPGLSDAAISWVVALLAALPTLIAALLSPELLLDDIEFAARARFEGFGGFIDEMGYRPGQGLIHGLQFTLLGNRPALHLVVLAIGNGATAMLFWRLLRSVVSRPIALGSIAAFVVLPNRGSLRFWTSTLPNHVAMCLLLGAALIAIRSVQHSRSGRLAGAEAPDHRLPSWLGVTALSFLSVITYEATIGLAGLLVAVMAFTSSTLKGRVIIPAGVLSLYGGTALVLTSRSPRAPASTFFANPVDAVPSHLRGLFPVPLDQVGTVLVIGTVLWAAWTVLSRRAHGTPEASSVLAGVVIAAAGLAPFIAAGFNIQSAGVLDRAHYFPSLGTSLILGSTAAFAWRITDSPVVRPAMSAAALLLAVGIQVDLTDYVRAADDHRDARTALGTLSWSPNDTTGESGVRIAPPNTAGGVAWGFYNAQVRDLYRIVHDDPVDPLWLAFGSSTDEDTPSQLAYFDIEDGALIPVGD